MKTLFLLSFIIFFFCLNNVMACMCGESTIKQDFIEAKAVFVGKVVSGGYGKWTVEVSKVWKGKVQKEIKFFDTSQNETSMTTCSAVIKNGVEYIFFAVAGKNKKATSEFYFTFCKYVVEWNTWDDILRISDKEKFWKTLKSKKTVES